MQKEFWTFILDRLQCQKPVTLLVVVDSNGSSPGRQGFKMAIDEDGTMCGSIGGGVMEHKLVELGKDMLQKKDGRAILKRQVHSKQSSHQSGMICSGEQVVAIIILLPEVEVLVSTIINAVERLSLQLSDEGFNVVKFLDGRSSPVFSEQNDHWLYEEQLLKHETVHIVGAGHVGLALSELLRWLGYYVKVYDDREGLNTFEKNTDAHEKINIDYSEIDQHLHEDDYCVIVSFGYRTDKEILKRLSGRRFKYIGMMGSKYKTKQIIEELLDEGVDREFLQSVYAPIGVQIGSKTPQEIAVSIAAQITQIRQGLSRQE